MNETDLLETGETRANFADRRWSTRTFSAVAAAAVLANALLTGYLALETHQMWQQNRQVYCLSYLNDGSGGITSYNKLSPYERAIADNLDCEVPGR